MTELQARLLGLLKELDRLCRKHGVEYYLTGGSLIGAVRHRGFIPWDDDADVIMTRENWEKFYPAVLADLPEHIALNSQDGNADLALPISHFTDITTTGIYRYFISNPENAGVVIDILVMDPVPDTPEDRDIYVRELTEHTELTNPYYQYSLRIEKETAYEQNLKLAKKEGRRAVMDRIVSRAFHYTEEESSLYAQRFASAPHFWPKEYFGRPRYVPFEDTELPIPEHAGDCLCIGYDDDWMYIPQGGPNKSTHEFCVHDYHVPCQVMLDEFESYIDREKVMALIEKRKKLQVKRTDDRMELEAAIDSLTQARVRLKTKRALEGEDLDGLVASGSWTKIRELLGEYLSVQLSNRFVGSSSLAGWFNWGRKCRPVLIDIGDGPIYAAVMTLLHEKKLAAAGKILKARKRTQKALTDDLKEADALYGAVCRIRSLDERGERDPQCAAQCDALLAEWLERSPGQPLLEITSLKRRARSMDPETLLRETGELLEKYPEDPELLGLKGDALFAAGRLDEMTQLYRELACHCTHGLVMLGMRERMRVLCEENPEREDWHDLWLLIRRQSGEPEESILGLSAEDETAEEGEDSQEEQLEPEEQEGPGEEEKPAADDAAARIRKVRLTLLKELDEICGEENIPCFLSPALTREAVLTGSYGDAGREAVLYIFAEHAQKLAEAVRRKAQPDRGLSSMADHGDFPRLCLQYYDTSTLDMKVSESHREGPCGIHAVVELLRHPGKSEAAGQFERMLEIGWESRSSVKYSSLKVQTARAAVGALCAVCGPKRAAGLLSRHFVRASARADERYRYVKPYWGFAKKYPAGLFGESVPVMLDGVTLHTVRDTDRYLETAFGRDWRENAPSVPGPSPTRIIDPNLPAEEYFAFLKEEGIDRRAIHGKWYANNRKYSYIRTLGGFIGAYWNLYEAIGERHRLYRKYVPMKERLEALRASGSADEMMRLLKDYADSASRFAKKKIGLTFDPEITKLLLFAMEKTGRGEEAKTLRAAFEKQKWAGAPGETLKKD